MTTEQYTFLIPISYLLASMVLLAFRNTFAKKILIFCSIIINLVGFGAVLYFANSRLCIATIPWVTVGNTQLNFDIFLDNASWLMLGLVQFISLAVQLYSIKYMGKEPRISTYYAFLNLFIGAMLGLIISGNLLFIFLFWELVGFCSYLLIGFWFEKQSATEAASKAFMVNKVGDSFLLIGIGLIYAASGSLEIESIKSAITANPSLGLIPVASFMLFLGSLAKSAQVPLQVWLPDAMEGPTPVSALIHAATMVAAGIFLLARFDFMLTDFTLVSIAITGAVTACMAGYSALFQWDIKKILAYSTISQLGMMMVAIGIGKADLALFHLFTHAFFKAGLFLIAGALIHYVHHEQDIRKLGEISTNRVFLKIAFLICGASLAGFPLFSGFLSKETILLSTLGWDSGNVALNWIVPFLFIIASLFTVIYLSKIAYFVFFQNKQKATIKWTVMEITIAILAFLSLASPQGLNILDPSETTFALYFNVPETQYHEVGWVLVVLSIFLAILSFYYFKKERIERKSIWVKIGLNHFYIDYFYSIIVTRIVIGSNHFVQITDELEHDLESEILGSSIQIPKSKKGINAFVHKFDIFAIDGLIGVISKMILKIATVSSWLDDKTVDGIVDGVSNRINGAGDSLRRIQSGKLQEYLIATILILIFTILLANIL